MKTLLIILCILIASPVMGGLEFDEADSTVFTIADDTSLDFSITNAMTISLWAKSTTTQVHALIGDSEILVEDESFVIFDNNGVFWARIENSLNAQFDVNGGTWTSGTWYHVVLSCDGGHVRLYSNGVELDNIEFTGTIKHLGNPIHIGSRGTGWTPSNNYWFYNGTMYDFRFYNRALSLAEIQSIYHSRGSDNIVNGLVGRWLMNEGTNGSSISASPVSQWKMNDDAADTTVIDSVGSNTGTSQATTSSMSVTGKINDALEFDTTVQDYISFGDVLDIEQNDFSLAFWFQTPSGTKATNEMVVDKRDGTDRFAFYFSDLDQVLIFLFGDGTTIKAAVGSSNQFNDGAWHYAVGIIDYGNNMYLYVDNNLIETTDISAIVTPQSNSNPLVIGTASDNLGVTLFNGKVDDVRIYDLALSVNEMTGLWNSGHGTEEERNPQILDISGSGNNGTPINSPVYRATPIKLIRRPR